MKYLLIVNPASGDRKTKKKVERVLGWFARKGDVVELRWTAAPGDATKIADAVADNDFDAVIGAGGDGTINEVLNGMVGKKTPLAILPWGTGNVFAKEMHFPRRLKKLCKVIRKGRSILLDVGRCGARHFLLMASAGFDAYALKQMEGRSWKKRLGMAAYALAASWAFSKYSFPEIEVKLDGYRVEKGSFALVSNTRLYGAFFTFNPDASPTDGLLDLFLFRERGRWHLTLLIVRLIFRSLFGGFFTAKRKKRLPESRGFFQCKSVEIQSNAQVFSQLDGDFYEPLPQRIEVVPQAVEVLLPKSTAKRFSRQ